LTKKVSLRVITLGWLESAKKAIDIMKKEFRTQISTNTMYHALNEVRLGQE
jgi:hypothetical protein